MRQFLRFFGGSAVGLFIDLSCFQLLVVAGLEPWQANTISSTLALTAVYFLVARFAFATRAHVRTYVLFFAWYGANIVIFGALINLAVDLTGWAPLLCKLASIPLSFLLNYLFSRALFRSPSTTSS
jgi:putative flippase GtrA